MSGTRLLALVIGFWVLMRAVSKDSTGRTLVDHVVGNKASKSPLLNMPLAAANSAGASNSAGEVNPVPGASGAGGRLDQGVDVTGKNFLAPFSGKVVASDQINTGWGGGGLVAIQDAADPHRVVSFAEGIAPIVRKGQTVTAGERIGTPIQSPFASGGFGSIEIFRANPANPSQPLAQIVSDPASMVRNFYNWLRSLGAPAVSNTAGAGRA